MEENSLFYERIPYLAMAEVCLPFLALAKKIPSLTHNIWLVPFGPTVNSVSYSGQTFFLLDLYTLGCIDRSKKKRENKEKKRERLTKPNP
jgi:hypothetical protein